MVAADRRKPPSFGRTLHVRSRGETSLRVDRVCKRLLPCHANEVTSTQKSLSAEAQLARLVTPSPWTSRSYKGWVGRQFQRKVAKVAKTSWSVSSVTSIDVARRVRRHELILW